MPVLPTVDKIKTALIDYLLENSSIPGNKVPPNNPSNHPLRDTLCKQVEKPHLTLELLCSLFAYRSGVANKKPRFNAARLWQEICKDAECSVVAFCLAALAEKGEIGPILTSNFDCMLYDAMSGLGVESQIVTDRSLRSNSPAPKRDSMVVVAFHGTTYGIDPDNLDASEHSPPTSALARGLARPLSSELSNFINACLAEANDRPIICIGYSGNDHYDMNPLLSSLKAPTTERLFWLSYRGNPEDFSPFVRDTFADRLFAGSADQLLMAYCNARLPSRRTVVKELNERLSQGGHDQSWRSKLNAALASFAIPADRCDTLVSDIRCNLPGVFAVLEHYYLYSSAYLESQTLVFAGVRRTEHGLSADHLRFFDLPFDELLWGQVVYREEDRKQKNLPSLRERTFYGYPETCRILAHALESILRKIESSARLSDEPTTPELYPEYRAVWYVGVAIAYDYLGLVGLKRLMALEALLEALDAELKSRGPGAIIEVERKTVQHEIESTRTLTLAHFGACEEFASSAQKLIGGDRDTMDQWLLEQLVQASTWVMIGKDNRPRAARRTDSYEMFRSAIEFRQRELGRIQEPELKAAHYPQLWLRASEWLKKILDIRSDQGAFAKDLTLAATEEGHLAEAMQVLEDAYRGYQQVSGKVQSRFPAVFDARLIHEAWTRRHAPAHERTEALRPVLEEMDRCFSKASEDVQQDAERWVQNIHARAKKLAQ